MICIDLKNKTALVTGATGELGRTILKTLAKAGADVIIHYHRNEAKAKELKEEVEALGVKAYITNADVSDNKAIMNMAQDIKDNFKMPDIIVNNSYISSSFATILEQDVADFENQFRGSVLHNVNMAKAFVPTMIGNKFGRVIGINTIQAMANTPTMAAYVSGKRGMDGILRVLAKEVGCNNITVNQIAPGWTISDKERESNAQRDPNGLNDIPMKRWGTDYEVANAVVFLASDLADYITGVYLPVSGGAVMPTI